MNNDDDSFSPVFDVSDPKPISTTSSSSSTSHKSVEEPIYLTGKAKPAHIGNRVAPPPVSGFQPFGVTVSSNFEDITNKVLAEPDKWARMGKAGKFVAKHRSRLFLAAMVLMTLGGLVLLWAIGNALYYSMLTVAAKVNYMSKPDSVLLANGVLVENVHQPVTAIQTHSQAAMVLRDVETTKMQDRRPLSEALIKGGFLQWRVVANQPLHNFTLAHTEKMIAAFAANETQSANNCTCMCFVEFGIAENAVYLRAAKEFLYEPLVVSTINNSPSPADHIPCKSERHTHLTSAARRVGEAPPKVTTGKIHYVTNSGGLRQRGFTMFEFGCVRDCIGYFK